MASCLVTLLRSTDNKDNAVAERSYTRFRLIINKLIFARSSTAKDTEGEKRSKNKINPICILFP